MKQGIRITTRVVTLPLIAINKRLKKVAKDDAAMPSDKALLDDEVSQCRQHSLNYVTWKIPGKIGNKSHDSRKF